MKIERIYIINLDKRTDRWERCKKKLEEYGLFDIAVRISAIENPDNPGYGNHLSHAKALRMAKEYNNSNCLILEDDIEILENLWIYLEPTLLEIPEDWDLFYLGINMDNFNAFQISSHVAKINGGFATHAYMVNEKVYDNLIYLNENCINEPNDVKMSREFILYHNCYVSIPLLIGQENGYSDIMKQYMNYNNMFQNRFENRIIRNRKTIKPDFCSFIVPSMNRPTLYDSINSVVLSPEWNWECHVMMDGVSVSNYIANEHVHYHYLDKLGSAGLVRNEGFKFVDTRWTCFLDDDDEILLTYIPSLMKYSRDNPKTDIIIFTYIDETNGRTCPGNGDNRFIVGNVPICFAIKTEFIRKYNIKFKDNICEDFDFIMDCKRLGANILFTHDYQYKVKGRGLWVK
jgi:GR25 family glycosyltransferase involved in LPS biosynthesis